MLIENVDAFKTWLAKLLEPICDADPGALANYVIALVKKDKSEMELKAVCADQLDVFLQKETNDFVNKMFDSLQTKVYLPPEETISTDLKQEKEEIKEEIPEKPPVPMPVMETFEEERDNRKKKHPSPPRNRSDSSERRTREKKREDGKWRDYDRHRDKYDWRRGRSKSPVKSKSTNRSRSRSRGRSRERESTRNRGNAKGNSVQQPTSVSLCLSTEHRERQKFESERSELETAYTPCSQLGSSSVEQQYSSGGQAIPSTVTVIAPAPHPESTTEIWSNYYNNHNPPNSFNRNPPPKRRCRDYDERGFCVLGDLCQFDHGNDPLVVDEVSLPTMIPFPPPPGLPPPGILLPPIPGPVHNMRMPVLRPHSQPPPSAVLPAPSLPLPHSGLLNNRDRPVTSTVPSLAPIVGGLPPPIPPPNLLYSVSEHTYEPDGYNPEAPSLTNTGRPGYRTFLQRQPTQRSNLIGLTSCDMDTAPRAANIVIQTEPPASNAGPVNNNRVVVEPDRKRTSSNMDGPFAKKPWMDRQGNHNHNKTGFVKKIQYTNTKLEVRKIPQDLNNITKLNEHFSKFGTIVNIQVAFQGDPEGALIQYLTNDEARRAISSTEAVLNNRFIRVLWHRENNEQQHTQPQHLTPHAASTTQAPIVPAGQGHMQKVMPKAINPGSYVLNKLPAKQPSSGEENQTLPPSTSLSKMVYSSASLKTSNKPAVGSKTVDMQDALKKKQDALKLQQDMRKKKQEMLEKQIECQKMLISRLEKNKSMKAEERTEIMKTLKGLDEKISRVKDELKTLSGPSKVKSKTEAQKELLDAEMDFHKRLSSGEDTTELRKKLSQLQVEAARLGILPPSRGKTLPGQSRGRGRGHGTRGRGSLSHMVVDHRPKTIAVAGFYDNEKEELLQHFAKFGDVEDLKEEEFPPSVILTFRTRQEAETAANQGSKFKGQKLQVSWHKPKTPSISTEIEEEETKEEEAETSDPFLHDDEDEDEEEDDESRSWRR
ncbi:RNA-binding protein 27 isoform X1 [Xenopus laevis]|uniref:RNA-binding protein 27 isoform X1 n=1 Tax=Xenopus laevis TaxID=8355 RepID=A0A8J0UY23_XENLA|nr:RNA-binding protein 27 isoform X1 [Xenopus laevis]